MMKNRFLFLVTLLAALSCACAAAHAAVAVPFDSATLAQRSLQRRAVELAIWGVPIVSVEAMRQAYFRDAGAQYNDIVYWSKPSGWHNQTTTPNSSALYVYFNVNTRSGPVVIEIPPAQGAGVFGSLLDAWQVPLVDVGPEGEDKGLGGKYVLLPPDYSGAPPAGYLPVSAKTYNAYSLLRMVPASGSAEDRARAQALIQQLRVYPLAQAGAPAAQRRIDMDGRLFDGIVHYDASFFGKLSSMLNEEPVQQRDKLMMGMARSLGMERGKSFQSGSGDSLQQAAQEAHAWLMDGMPQQAGAHFWPERQWRLPVTPAAVRSAFTWEDSTLLDVDGRGVAFFWAYAAPMKIGKASFYLTNFADAKGQALQGEHSYHLHVPAKVPARQFWSLNVYDRETGAFIRQAARVGLDSLEAGLERNADGSVDLFVGPTAPPGHAANWIPTLDGKPWFPLFRLYGPEKSLMDKSWQLPDFERL